MCKNNFSFFCCNTMLALIKQFLTNRIGSLLESAGSGLCFLRQNICPGTCLSPNYLCLIVKIDIKCESPSKLMRTGFSDRPKVRSKCNNLVARELHPMTPEILSALAVFIAINVDGYGGRKSGLRPRLGGIIGKIKDRIVLNIYKNV